MGKLQKCKRRRAAIAACTTYCIFKCSIPQSIGYLQFQQKLDAYQDEFYQLLREYARIRKISPRVRAESSNKIFSIISNKLFAGGGSLPMWNHSKSLLLTAVWIRVALLAWIIIAQAATKRNAAAKKHIQLTRRSEARFSAENTCPRRSLCNSLSEIYLKNDLCMEISR